MNLQMVGAYVIVVRGETLTDNKFPLGQKFKVSGFQFQFTGIYNRDRYKVRLLEKSTLDFTNYKFSAGFKTFKFVRRINNKVYRVKEIK